MECGCGIAAQWPSEMGYLDGDSATIRNFGQNGMNRCRNGKSVEEAPWSYLEANRNLHERHFAKKKILRSDNAMDSKRNGNVVTS